MVSLNPQQFGPLAQGGEAYAARQGFAGGPRPDYSQVTANPGFARAVAQRYEAAPTFDERAVPHFDAMRHETARQFDYLTAPRRRGGMGIDVRVQDHDPYGNAGEMLRDLHENQRLRVLGTNAPGGGSHPYFTPEENDQFRAVHDAFGHAATGRGFDRHGEEAAYQSHSRMYSPAARPAMTTETRGQNSTFIYGKRPGVFPQQKIVTLPGAGRIVPIGRRSVQRATLLQAAQFHAQMFPGASPA